ncbi:MAG TPA: hypothetical protein VHI99_14980 [Vicinamibacterales bacterium]|nr:hypothetical protein [Vicinamibacterales bacterium]
MNGLNWYWIALELTLAPAAGFLLAYPLWRKGQAILGNIAGTVAIFGTAIGLIFREYAVLDRATQACLEAGYTCWPDPSAFTRFAIYAFIGLFEVLVLFSVSLVFESRHSRRDYSPEWR